MKPLAQRPSASKEESPQALGPSVASESFTPQYLDAPASQALPGALTTASEPFVKAEPQEKIPSLIEQAVRAWAKETSESAPPRQHLDYALHVEDCLPALIENLESL